MAGTKPYPTQLVGSPKSDKTREVTSPYSGDVIGSVEVANADILNHAFAVAEKAHRETTRKMPAYKRAEILEKTADLVESNLDDYAMTIALEGGKPLTDARVETSRAANTLRLSAEAALALDGEQPVMGRTAAGDNMTSFIVREPIGVISSISAFNHPLNLSAHLIGPSLAPGNSVVLKPAAATPLCSMKLGQHFLQAGLPEDALSIVNCSPPLAEQCTTDPRIRFLNFIGSDRVGWGMRGKLPIGARVMLEHGGSSPAIVEPDVNIEKTVASCVKGGFYHAGQVCVSLQRLMIHEDIYDEFLSAFVTKVKELKVGDPTLSATEVGPLIRESSVQQMIDWVKEAQDMGAKALCGAERLDNNCYAPTVIEGAKKGMRIHDLEIFGPAVNVYKYSNLDDALEEANHELFAFQSSIYTQDIDRALHAAREFDATAVMINEHPAYRVDWMPFGGRRASGIGMGGVRYAAEEMSVMKIINIRKP